MRLHLHLSWPWHNVAQVLTNSVSLPFGDQQMMRLLCGLLAATMMLALAATVTAELQPPKGEGPPKKEGKGEKGDKKGPPMGKEGDKKGFQLGKVLPPFAYDQLELTKDQEKQIADLEKEVKAKLEKILTAAQKRKLEDLRPPMGGPGGPKGDRPGEPAPMPRPEREQAGLAEGIQWFAVLDQAKADARRLNKPILLTNGTPHCSGISGIW
jgi:hypothetical protein